MTSAEVKNTNEMGHRVSFLFSRFSQFFREKNGIRIYASGASAYLSLLPERLQFTV